MVSPRGLLGLPAYLTGVGAMFWVFQLAVLTGFVKAWRFGPDRNDIMDCVRFLKWFFRFRVRKLGTQTPCTAKCVYLANHRSWADFFVDMYVTSCRAVPLSRRAVGAAFPAFTTSLVALRSILLFNRQGVRDKERFNAWLDVELASGPQTSLLLYPEGTRSQRDGSLPLKRGMLRYAHTRRLPVQVVITVGKELVLNERRCWAHFNRTLVTGCSEVLESSRFEEFDDFMAAVQKLWDAQWDAVHAAPKQGLPELPEPVAAGGNYSRSMLAKQTLALAAWMAVLLGVVRLSLRVLTALARLPGGAWLVGALALWTLASLAAAATLPAPVKRSRPAAAAAVPALANGASGSAAADKKEG